MVVVCNTSQQQHPEERVIIQHISQMNPNEDVRLNCSKNKLYFSIVWVPLFISYLTPPIFTMVYIFGTMLFGGAYPQHRGWDYKNDSEAAGRLGDVKNLVFQHILVDGII